MNIEHLNLVYQQIVNQSNIIPASENAETVDMKQLYASFCEQKGGFTKWLHMEQCKAVAQILSNAIDVSSLLSDEKKATLIKKLKDADFLTIVSVLEELGSDFR